LSSLGVTEQHIDEIARQASARAELQNTPDPPALAELDQLLRAAL
jgi:alcohol dehydrogenase class IV